MLCILALALSEVCVCGAQYGCSSVTSFMLSQYVAQLFSELFWRGSICFYYWHHFRFYIPHALYFYRKVFIIIVIIRVHDGAVGWGTALQAGRSQVRFPIMLLEFYIDVIPAATLWSWDRLRLQQKWVPDVSPAGKSGRCVRLTTANVLLSTGITCLVVVSSAGL